VKGLILAAGLGTRLRPITSLRPKPTITVAGKPLIHYAVDDLVDVGITDIGIVVSRTTRSTTSRRRSRATATPPTPTCCRTRRRDWRTPSRSPRPSSATTTSSCTSATTCSSTASAFVDAFRADDGVNAVLALVRVEDPRSFGVAVVEDGRITRLVEKPADPPSDLAVAGVYVFDAGVHDAIEGLEPGAKGEYQITDAIARMIEAAAGRAHGGRGLVEGHRQGRGHPRRQPAAAHAPPPRRPGEVEDRPGGRRGRRGGRRRAPLDGVRAGPDLRGCRWSRTPTSARSRPRRRRACSSAPRSSTRSSAPARRSATSTPASRAA
jgi:glucose-1-phosphate thymidylyltransferase